MAFVDVINSYAPGTGVLTTTSGDTVGYTISGNAATASRGPTSINNDAAQITADGSRSTTVTFDQAVHGMTIAVGRSNIGELYFIEIDGQQINLSEAIANGDIELTETTPGKFRFPTSGGIEGTTGNGANNNIAYLHFQRPVVSVRIFGTGGTNRNFDLFDIGVDSVDFRTVCFVAGTQIGTPRGPVAVETLVAGDSVTTLDSGLQPVLDTQCRVHSAAELRLEPRLAPVRLREGSLGYARPDRPLWVSRQHRMMIASRVAQRITGHPEVLVPAIQLAGLSGINVPAIRQPVKYIHLLLARHHVVFANGAPAETLLPGAGALAAMGVTARLRLNLICPMPDTEPARPILDAKTLRKVLLVHRKQSRPLLETFNAPQFHNFVGQPRVLVNASKAASVSSET
jgi:hypothetical protein